MPRIDTIEYQIMSALTEQSPAALSSAMLINAINDGHKDVAAKSLCLESESVVSTVPGSRFVPFSGYKVKDIKDESTNLGVIETMPQSFGHNIIDGARPQYWFQWGGYVVLDPVPDAVYSLRLYLAIPPDTQTYAGAFYSQDDGFIDTDGVFEWEVPPFITGLPAEFIPSITDFAIYALAIKLKRWGKAVESYNTYVSNLAKRKVEYISHHPESPLMPRVPKVVAVQGGTSWER
jgi:hypothetical protein